MHLGGRQNVQRWAYDVQRPEAAHEQCAALSWRLAGACTIAAVGFLAGPLYGALTIWALRRFYGAEVVRVPRWVRVVTVVGALFGVVTGGLFVGAAALSVIPPLESWQKALLAVSVVPAVWLTYLSAAALL
jgi:hypothetical protein